MVQPRGSHFNCPLCKITFKTRGVRDLHMSREHKAETWPCSDCEQRFSTRSRLKNHLKSKHGKVHEHRQRETTYSEFSDRLTELLQSTRVSRDARVVPYEEALPYYHTSISRNRHPSKARFMELNIKFNKLIENLSFPHNFVIFVKSLVNIIAKEMKKVNARASDIVQFTFRSDQIEKPVAMPLVKLEQASVLSVLNSIDRVLQSHEEFTIDSGINLSMTYLPMNDDLLKIAGLGRRSQISVKEFFDESQYLIGAPPHLKRECFVFALAAGLYSLDKKGRKRFAEFRRISLSTSLWMDSLVKSAAQGPGPWTVDQCAAIANVFYERENKKTSVHCLALKGTGFERVWVAGSKTNDRNIFILLFSGHAYLVLKPATLLNPHYLYCYQCGVAVKKEHRSCPAIELESKCDLCAATGCSNTEGSLSVADSFPKYECELCFRRFHTAACLNRHSVKRCISPKKQKCRVCMKTDDVANFSSDNVHIPCGTEFCWHCKKRREVGHKFHFMHKTEIKQPKRRVIKYYWDAETLVTDKSSGDGAQIFILIVLKKPGERIHYFRGYSAVTKFMTHLLQEKFDTPTKRVILAHNFSRFDSNAILSFIYKNRYEPSIRFNGQTCMSIYFSAPFYIHFKCTALFIARPLDDFSQMFGIKTKKSYFPFWFHTKNNADYIGPLPDKAYYRPEIMKESRKKAFDEWYNQEKLRVGESWNMRKVLDEYCLNDVDLLSKGAEAFSEMFERVTGFDPFVHCLTAAGTAMTAFRSSYLKDDLPIVICGDRGFSGDFAYSSIACRWLSYLEHKYDIHIESALHGPEPRWGRLKVDGLLKTRRNLPGLIPEIDEPRSERVIVFQFYGCVYHSCPSCFPNPKVWNPVTRATTASVRARNSRIAAEIRQSAVLVEQWECQLKKELEQDTAMKSFFRNETAPFAHFNVRSGLFGGRTECYKQFYTPKEGETINFTDCNSLYPAIQALTEIPIDAPEVRRSGFESIDLRVVFGLIVARVLPPYGLHIPVLPSRINGKLMFPLCRTCAENEQASKLCDHDENSRSLPKQMYTSTELKLALAKGYRVIQIFEIWSWKKRSSEVFKDFIFKFYRLKLCASGIPRKRDPEEYLREINEYYQFNLKLDDFTTNKPLKAVCKVVLNSIWGKFSQRTTQEHTKLVSSYSEISEFLKNPFFTDRRITKVSDRFCLLSYKDTADVFNPPNNLSIIVAIFCTANARTWMYERVFNKLNTETQPLYMDTDSILYVTNEQLPQIETTDGIIGGFCDEIPEGCVIKAYFCGSPKNYGILYEDAAGRQFWSIKAKGLRLTSETLSCLSVEEMYRAALTLDRSPFYIVDSGKIRRSREAGKVYSVREEKKWQINTQKRIVEMPQGGTFPYGFAPKQ